MWAHPGFEIILIFGLAGNEEGQKGMVESINNGNYKLFQADYISN